jgi:hypothetical protein
VDRCAVLPLINELQHPVILVVVPNEARDPRIVGGDCLVNRDDLLWGESPRPIAICCDRPFKILEGVPELNVIAMQWPNDL